MTVRESFVNDPAESLETWLVGGAVRDRLLAQLSNRSNADPADDPVDHLVDSSNDHPHATDRDWVVIGATPEQLVELGFKPVGRDFPVFLHPISQEEYALARTERKQAPGYRGFSIDADPSVTLDEDLSRRDLTINAMAMNASGELRDPFNGADDIKQRVLRHVSDAFAEDPVRILRVARFSARLAHLGFTVHATTVAMMRQLVDQGEVDALVTERIWRETQRALTERTPSAFFQTLRSCGALRIIFPEIDELFGIPQTAKWHPEVDTGVHVMMVIDAAARSNATTRSRFACLCHDLGKAETPQDVLPSHPTHEHNGVPLVDELCDRIRVPTNYRRLARVVCRHHLKMHNLTTLKPGTVVDLLDELGAFRQHSLVAEFAACCAADARGRLGKENDDYPQAALLKVYADATTAVTAASFVKQGLTGKAVGEAIRLARCDAIRALRRDNKSNKE